MQCGSLLLFTIPWAEFNLTCWSNFIFWLWKEFILKRESTYSFSSTSSRHVPLLSFFHGFWCDSTEMSFSGRKGNDFDMGWSSRHFKIRNIGRNGNIWSCSLSDSDSSESLFFRIFKNFNLCCLSFYWSRAPNPPRNSTCVRNLLRRKSIAWDRNTLSLYSTRQ